MAQSWCHEQTPISVHFFLPSSLCFDFSSGKTVEQKQGGAVKTWMLRRGYQTMWVRLHHPAAAAELTQLPFGASVGPFPSCLIWVRVAGATVSWKSKHELFEKVLDSWFIATIFTEEEHHHHQLGQNDDFNHAYLCYCGFTSLIMNIVEGNLGRGRVGSTHPSFLSRGHSVRLRQRPSGDMDMMRRCGCSQDKTVRDTQLRWWRQLEVRDNHPLSVPE